MATGAGDQVGDVATVGGDELVRRLSATLAGVEIFVGAEVRDGTLFLSGEVDSADNHRAVLDVAAALADPAGLAIDDSIEVMPTAPEAAFELGDDPNTAADLGATGFAYVGPDQDGDGLLDAAMEIEPDFGGPIGTTDSQEAAAEAVPYFPPTDPVVRVTDDREGLAVVGGFEATSLSGDEDAAGFDVRNDDDITQAVMRELAQDALTQDLVVQADTRDGVVRLRGAVETLDDAENAEAVAAGVSGVQEVIEELDVVALEGQPRER